MPDTAKCPHCGADVVVIAPVIMGQVCVQCGKDIGPKTDFDLLEDGPEVERRGWDG